jgi:RNA-directed DNA polymerase
MKDRKALRGTIDPSSEAWNKLPWKKFERHVFRIQKRIYQASQSGNQRAVQKLQKLLMKSEAARLLAVRRVTQDNQARKTAGVDGVKAVKPKERLVLAKQIHPNKWKRAKAQPVRRVSIPKPGKAETRPLGIPVIRDKAQQTLVKFALEPEWEARFEPNSYGFRPGRSCHDAIVAVWISINHKEKYVLNADLKECFENINQQALLQKLKAYPQMRRIMRNWLRAGVMNDGVFEETTSGTPQGGAISPLLANIALHGMETLVKKAFRQREQYPTLIRHADDFVVFHHTEEGVLRAKDVLETWLKEMGLEMKPNKIRIGHTLNDYQGKVGFDFLGWNVKQFPVGKTHRSVTGGKYSKPLGFKTIIRPSKEKVRTHMQEIKEVIMRHASSDQNAVIKGLNPIIRGWTAYYKTMVAAEEFSTCDHKMWKLLWRWAKKRHPRKGAGWRRERYWQTVEQRQWVFMTPKDAKLRQHTLTKIQRHVKVKGEASPYDGNMLYWSQRLKNNPMLHSVKGYLLSRQQGKCKWCDQLFREADIIEIDHIQPRSQGGSEKLDNKCLLHGHCHDQRHATKEAKKETSVNNK